jgi:imidazolonepropionase-like amidohydrolase
MNKKILLCSVFIMLFISVPFLRSEETILIQGGTIVPVTGSVIQKGSLLIQNGKIVEIGKDIQAPLDARIIDAEGMFVYPGFISPLTAVGVTGYPGAGYDIDEVGVSTPHMDPYDALNPEDDCIDVTRIEGVTTVMTIGGTRNAISGKSLVMNLEGDFPEDMVIKKYTAQIFNMGGKESEKYPSTLPGVASFIREKLIQTKKYMEEKKEEELRKKEGRRSRGRPFVFSLEKEALIPVIKGEVPVLFITSDEVTIRNALGMIKEFKLKGILYARADILKFADILAREKISVIWAGTMTIPRRWEPFDLNYRTASVLAAKGVLFAFEQSGWRPSSRNARNLPVPASMSVAHGLSEEEAIKALTINPARILGVDDRVGSLEMGKMANVVVWKGNPLQMRSRVHTVIINGKIIPLTSVQTRLRDKFDKIVRERLKKKKDTS